MGGAALRLLQECGAAEIDHPGGTLLDHLVRVSDRLVTYGASSELALAGLVHAAYSTDGYDTALQRHQCGVRDPERPPTQSGRDGLHVGGVGDHAER